MDSNHECFAVFGGAMMLPMHIVRLTRNLQEEKFSDVLILRVSSIERAVRRSSIDVSEQALWKMYVFCDFRLR